MSVLAALAVVCVVALAPGRLASMPLPKAALGPDADRLALAVDSGVDSNADAARHAGAGVTAADLARGGRITGYTLDYVLPLTSTRPPAHALLGVQTIAELYRDDAAAARGLAFWRGVTRALGAKRVNGVTARVVPFPAHAADGAFGFELTYRRGGKPVLYVGDIVFRAGNLLGAVFVTAADEAGLRARTVSLAGRLEARIRKAAPG